MRPIAAARAMTALLALAVLAAGCGSSSDGAEEAFVAPLGGSDTDRYRWEVCRTITDAHDPTDVTSREISFGYADHDRGLFTADHVRRPGTQQESRIQLATQGGDLVSRQVEGTEPDTAFLRDVPFVSLDTPLDVAQLRTRQGVLEAFALTGVSSVHHTDSHNFEFERFESLPVAPRPPTSDEPPASAVLGRPVTDVVWVLDVWSDDRGTVSRLRLMTRDIRRSVAELRFSPSVTRWEVDVVPVAEIGCPVDLAEPANGWLGYEAYEQTLVVPLQVSLDPDGLPYNVIAPEGVELSTRALDQLILPGGDLITMDGNAAQVDLAFFADGATTVDLGTATTLDVELIEAVSDHGTTILGVRLQVPDQTVARWGAFEVAYVTDGGTGAITTGSVVQRAIEVADPDEPRNPLSRRLSDDWANEDRVLVSDLDGVAGADTIMFANGFGEGAFPLSRGYNTAGIVVAVFVFDDRHPWRLMIPDGVAPSDVREREEQLVACMAGEREILGNGECVFDD